jgi:heme-degrading monooxygenase HmoA
MFYVVGVQDFKLNETQFYIIVVVQATNALEESYNTICRHISKKELNNLEKDFNHNTKLELVKGNSQVQLLRSKFSKSSFKKMKFWKNNTCNPCGPKEGHWVCNCEVLFYFQILYTKTKKIMQVLKNLENMHDVLKKEPYIVHTTWASLTLTKLFVK